MAGVSVQVRCYEELNDRLPPEQRKKWFTARLGAGATVRELVTLLAIPENEVDLVLVNGEAAEWSRRLEPGDRVSIYPVFETLDISSLNRLRPHPLRRPAFIAGPELSGVVQELQARGLDGTVAEEAAACPEALVRASLNERRILLTRDPKLAGDSRLERCLLLKSSGPGEQTWEVLERLNLLSTTR